MLINALLPSIYPPVFFLLPRDRTSLFLLFFFLSLCVSNYSLKHFESKLREAFSSLLNQVYTQSLCPDFLPSFFPSLRNFLLFLLFHSFPFSLSLSLIIYSWIKTSSRKILFSQTSTLDIDSNFQKGIFSPSNYVQ